MLLELVLRWNSNYLFLLFLFAACGCGVKSSPVPPKGTMLPSYVDKFLDSSAEDKKVENENKDKKQ